MYQLRLQLEKHGPKIVYAKGIHNIVADAISQLEYDPSVNQTAESYFMTKVNKNSIFKMQSETKLDGSLKTIVQTKSRHQQT
jgi:hypothetical protein